jgi:hypothetical protein
MDFQSLVVVDRPVDVDESYRWIFRRKRPWSVSSGWDESWKLYLFILPTSFKSRNVLTPNRTFSAFCVGAFTKVLREAAPRLPWSTHALQRRRVSPTLVGVSSSVGSHTFVDPYNSSIEGKAHCFDQSSKHR